MKTKLQFSRLDLVLLVINAVALGGLLLLLALGKASGPVVLMALGTFGMLVANLGLAYFRGRQPKSTQPNVPAKVTS